MKQPVILVTNDDGIHAKGLHALVDIVKDFGKVLVIAPMEGQSGMSHAITVKVPIRVQKLKEEENLVMYSCSGTPVDSVKMAISELITGKPDLLVSGINHGSNSSTSVVYSGTMAAAIEGAINEIPSIGFSLLDYDKDADFEVASHYARKIIEGVLTNGIPKGISLNVNIPEGGFERVKGVKICRQNKGVWREEFDKRKDPFNREYYWLTGEFHDLEPDSDDTDQWALLNNYVSVVPVKFDLTSYEMIDELNNWKL